MAAEFDAAAFTQRLQAALEAQEGSARICPADRDERTSMDPAYQRSLSRILPWQGKLPLTNDEATA